LQNLRKSKKGLQKLFGQMIHGYRSMLGRHWTRMMRQGQNGQQQIQQRYNFALIFFLRIL
jgi:hypothetical protein